MAVPMEPAALRTQADTFSVISLYEERPWGNYLILSDSPTHRVKRIVVMPGQRLSYQRHKYRNEHWFIVKGSVSVTLEGVLHPLGPGDSIDIAIGQAHRMANNGSEPAVFIEVQTGTYFGEDDIERIEDDYGRVES